MAFLKTIFGLFVGFALLACTPHPPVAVMPVRIYTDAEMTAISGRFGPYWSPSQQDLGTCLELLKQRIAASNLRENHPLRRRFGDYTFFAVGRVQAGKNVLELTGTSDPETAKRLGSDPRLLTMDGGEERLLVYHYPKESRVLILIPRIDPLPER